MAVPFCVAPVPGSPVRLIELGARKALGLAVSDLVIATLIVNVLKRPVVDCYAGTASVGGEAPRGAYDRLLLRGGPRRDGGGA